MTYAKGECLSVFMDRLLAFINAGYMEETFYETCIWSTKCQNGVLPFVVQKVSVFTYQRYFDRFPQ